MKPEPKGRGRQWRVWLRRKRRRAMQTRRSLPGRFLHLLAGKKLVTATMLAVFIAELAPTALQWVTGACFPRRVLEDRPLLGAVTQLPGLAHEPVNEMGVILLFGMVARQLGFIVESVQAGFPDCEARMEI